MSRAVARLVGSWLVLRCNPWSEPLEDRAAAYLAAVQALHVELVRIYWARLRRERGR